MDGNAVQQWAALHGVEVDSTQTDIQAAPIFPVVGSLDDLGVLLRWMVSEPELEQGARIYSQTRKISADNISAMANLERLYAQRREFMKLDWTLLSKITNEAYFISLTLMTRQAVSYTSVFPNPIAFPKRCRQ